MALGSRPILAGLIFLATGLMGELLMRIYFESSPARTYAVRRVVRRNGDLANPTLSMTDAPDAGKKTG